MFRTLAFALAAVALAASAVTSTASAAPRHGGHGAAARHGGHGVAARHVGQAHVARHTNHWNRNHRWNRHWHGSSVRVGFYAPYYGWGYGLGYAPYYASYGYGSYCVVKKRWVQTRWGARLQRVRVCR
jgi:hypothetical protein